MNSSNISQEHLSCDADQIVAIETTKKIRLVIYIVSFVSCFLGNGIVIAVSIQNRKTLSACRMLLAHLALTDLMFILRVPIEIKLEINGAIWPFNKIACKLMKGLNSSTLCASVFTMVVIAYERWRGVVHPTHQKWHRKHILVAVFVIWLLSICTYTPYMYHLTMRDCHCREKYDNAHWRKAYTVLLIVIKYFIPLAIISSCYAGLIKRLRKRPGLESTAAPSPTEQLRRENTKRIIAALIIVVVAFSLLTAPVAVYWLYFDLGDHQVHTTTALNMIEVFAALLFLHSSVNPIVYFALDRKFRRNVFSICACAGQSGQVRPCDTYEMEKIGKRAPGNELKQTADDSDL